MKLFTEDQKNLFGDLKTMNEEELKLWNILNVYIPIGIILIPAMLFTFLPTERVNFQNLVLNGSFSLLGINILFSMSTFLIYSMKMKDKKVETQIIELRKRLLTYLCSILLFSTIIYIVQIAFNIESLGQYITATIGCFTLLILSIVVGKKIYILKDELVGKSYENEINDNVEQLRNSTDDLE